MTGPRQIHNLALIGFMGTGKTTVGRLAAAQLRYEFVDTDDLIERRTGRRVAEIFERDGEEAFREMERALVSEMGGWRRRVIATGGGLGANEANLASLKQHSLTVCLWGLPDIIWQRVRHQAHRPLLHDPDPETKIRALLEKRAPIYRQADVLINTAFRSLREVTAQVLHQFHVARQRPIQGEPSH